jgi:hypothetical protein
MKQLYNGDNPKMFYANGTQKIWEYLCELEDRQPEELETDNWRNWKYIRNSITDKFNLPGYQKLSNKDE